MQCVLNMIRILLCFVLMGTEPVYCYLSRLPIEETLNVSHETKNWWNNINESKQNKVVYIFLAYTKYCSNRTTWDAVETCSWNASRMPISM